MQLLGGSGVSHARRRNTGTGAAGAADGERYRRHRRSPGCHASGRNSTGGCTPGACPVPRHCPRRLIRSCPLHIAPASRAVRHGRPSRPGGAWAQPAPAARARRCRPAGRGPPQIPRATRRRAPTTYRSASQLSARILPFATPHWSRTWNPGPSPVKLHRRAAEEKIWRSPSNCKSHERCKMRPVPNLEKYWPPIRYEIFLRRQRMGWRRVVASALLVSALCTPTPADASSNQPARPLSCAFMTVQQVCARTWQAQAALAFLSTVGKANATVERDARTPAARAYVSATRLLPCMDACLDGCVLRCALGRRHARSLVGVAVSH